MDSDLQKSKDRLVKELAKELTESNLAIFVGAGFSVPAGFVSWKQLMRPIAEELNLDIERESDMVSLAQYHLNRNQANRGKLNQVLVNEFSQNFTPQAGHKILARLPISTFLLDHKQLQGNGSLKKLK